jgi:hypothetical protein
MAIFRGNDGNLMLIFEAYWVGLPDSYVLLSVFLGLSIETIWKPPNVVVEEHVFLAAAFTDRPVSPHTFRFCLLRSPSAFHKIVKNLRVPLDAFTTIICCVEILQSLEMIDYHEMLSSNHGISWFNDISNRNYLTYIMKL